MITEKIENNNNRMKSKTVEECIRLFLSKKKVREPIFSSEIFFCVQEKMPYLTKTVFNEYLTRYLAKHSSIERYQKGIYYKTEITPFGKTGIDINALIVRRYMTDGQKIIGYETGPSLMQKIGLTTQIPSDIYISTEKVKKNTRNKEEKIVFLKPIAPITEQNYRYLQVLDILENRMEVSFECDKIKKIKEYMAKKGLSFERLVYYARYYDNIGLYRDLSELAGDDEK